MHSWGVMLLLLLLLGCLVLLLLLPRNPWSLLQAPA
jgi:hypothetical protein